MIGCALAAPQYQNRIAAPYKPAGVVRPQQYSPVPQQVSFLILRSNFNKIQFGYL